MKSSSFLFNLKTWSLKLRNIESADLDVAHEDLDQGNNCVLCNQKMNRKLKLECATCFLFKNILNDLTYQQDKRCKLVKENTWMDIRSEDKAQMAFCNFCNIQAKREFVFQVCDSCKDTACLSCLRKNEYLSSGICTNCSNRRKVSLISS